MADRGEAVAAGGIGVFGEEVFGLHGFEAGNYLLAHGDEFFDVELLGFVFGFVGDGFAFAAVGGFPGVVNKGGDWFAGDEIQEGVIDLQQMAEHLQAAWFILGAGWATI